MRLSLVIALFVAVGCDKTNPNYCPDGNCIKIDAAMRCKDSSECTEASAMVCKAPPGICVECLDNSTCTSATEAICDTATNRCVGCQAHADCKLSNACLPDGSCADPLQVAYASPAGTGTDCTLASPCGTLNDALAKNMPYVKLNGPGIIDDDKDTIISRGVMIVADPGAQLDRTTDGAILQLTGNNADVKIIGLEITGAGGLSNGDAILLNAGAIPKLTLERVVIHSNAHFGILASAGRVTIRRSVFSGNRGGGANLANVDFDITNSLFVANGDAQSTTGGLTLSPNTMTSVFQFNTVADNVSNSATMGSTNVNCSIMVKLSNSIVRGDRTAANCMFDYTLFDPGAAVSGTNVAGTSGFRNVDATAPTSQTYYRIEPTSAAVDGANPAAVEAFDIDGESRPKGAFRDMGADEVK